MSGHLFDKYGAILAEDVAVLEACINAIWQECTTTSRPPKICEIGMHDGGTAKGIERAFLNLGFPGIQYFGVDPDPGTTRPRHVPAGGKVIVGDSAEVFSQVSGDLDLLWVDGCHCFNHVILDTLHYAPKVRVGGFVCYHDVNPKGEGAEHQYHGPIEPEFGLAVNQALRVFGLPNIEIPGAFFEVFMERVPTDTHNCGTRAYRRIS